MLHQNSCFVPSIFFCRAVVPSCTRWGIFPTGNKRKEKILVNCLFLPSCPFYCLPTSIFNMLKSNISLLNSAIIKSVPCSLVITQPELVVIMTFARGISRAMYVALENILVDCVTLKKACFFNLEENQVKSILVLIALKMACENMCFSWGGIYWELVSFSVRLSINLSDRAG